MLKAAIFDIDGTLVDSVDLHARAWQEALAKFGHQVAFEQVRSQIGKGADQLLPLFLTPKEFDKYGEELEEYRGRLFQEKYLPLVKPFPGVRELFQQMLGDGRQIVLASSGQWRRTGSLQAHRPCRRSRTQTDLVGRRREVEAAS